MDCNKNLTRERDQEEEDKFLGVTTVSGSLRITLDHLGCLEYGSFLL
jgi:hypothetical protein